MAASEVSHLEKLYSHTFKLDQDGFSYDLIVHHIVKCVFASKIGATEKCEKSKCVEKLEMFFCKFSYYRANGCQAIWELSAKPLG